MKRIMLIAIRLICLFGLFVPYGYLPWFWAVPASIVFALVLAATDAKAFAAALGETKNPAQGPGGVG